MLNSDEFRFYDFTVVKLAEKVKQLHDKDTVIELGHWIYSNIRYKRDGEFYGQNYIQPPAVTFKFRQGNCLDMVALMSSVLAHLNIPHKIVLGYDKKFDSEYHVWIEYQNDKYVLADPARGEFWEGESKHEIRTTVLKGWVVKDETEWI